MLFEIIIFTMLLILQASLFFGETILVLTNKLS